MIGYAPVSTRGQDLVLQLDALKQAGCERIYKDVGSGTIRRRPELEACLDYLRTRAAGKINRRVDVLRA